MLKKTIIAFVAFAGLMSAQAATDATNWRASVDQLMNKGEFTQASQLMRKLPSKVRKANAAVSYTHLTLPTTRRV